MKDICGCNSGRADRIRSQVTFVENLALFIMALETYSQNYVDRVQAVMTAENDTRRALEIILNTSADRLLAEETPDGCLRCNSTLEMAETDPDIDKALARANETFVETIALPLKRAADRGEFSSERVDRLARFLTVTMNGMVTFAGVDASRDELGQVIEDALRFLDFESGESPG